MDKKFSRIEAIIKDLQGRTSMNFQNGIKPVLQEYYKVVENKLFEMPDPSYGGDDKNDGWVEENKIFYQIYAPRVILEKKSIISDLRDKFKSDLEGLVTHVIKGKKWGGEIHEFIFIYNTHDGGLPPETKSNYKKITKEIFEEYDCEFKVSLVNLDYIRELLEKLPNESLSKILKQLGNFTIDVLDEITPNAILETIELVCNEVYNAEMTEENDYRIITPEEKLDKNNLIKNAFKIRKILNKTIFMERVEREFININFELKEKFDTLKWYIIKEYLNLRKYLDGDDLYDMLIENLSNLINKAKLIIPTIELIVVFLFEKCDIFEK